MNGREALKALADGKRVCRARGEFIYRIQSMHLLDQRDVPCALSCILGRDDWEVVEEPATDEELIAEMVRFSRECPDSYDAPAAYAHCARLLRERKVDR